MKLDILVFASHPDDAELSCSGTIALHVAKGKKVGVVDLTRGELGTRGSIELRDKEALSASKILGLKVRENLELADGFFQINKESLLKVANCIRKYQPEIILANAVNDRHPDHGKGAKLVEEACFYSGVKRVVTVNAFAPWRPAALYHYIQSNYIEPDFVVDISNFWHIKEKSIRAFKSQFYDPNSKEPETYISKPGFLEFLMSRSKMWGQAIGVKYGEGFTVNRKIGIKNLFDLI
jgi:bacillithiol biosynthesis deacetylase BshB1